MDGYVENDSLVSSWGKWMDVGSSTELGSSGADSAEMIHFVLSLMCF